MKRFVQARVNGGSNYDSLSQIAGKGPSVLTGVYPLQSFVRLLDYVLHLLVVRVGLVSNECLT